MKKIIIAFICIACISTNSLAQEKLNINTTKSSITWFGEYTFYFGGHQGNIDFTEGYFIKTGDIITGGEFVIDMSSITNTDIKKLKAKKNLENHLKDPDFFDVKKYPFAKLEIISVEYFKNNEVRFHANMTIKGIKKPIKFNATLDYEKKSMTTRFKIDRRAWNVSYKSKFKNSAISDAIGFEVLIQL